MYQVGKSLCSFSAFHHISAPREYIGVINIRTGEIELIAQPDQRSVDGHLLRRGAISAAPTLRVYVLEAGTERKMCRGSRTRAGKTAGAASGSTDFVEYIVSGICLLLVAASNRWDRSALDDVLPGVMSKKGAIEVPFSSTACDAPPSDRAATPFGLET
jgi:hypothetical protein